MAMHQENLTAALALASAGIKIFPAGADKRPLLKGWQDAATCDADQINTWWDHAAALPAIPCGQNSLVVIDCDRHTAAPMASPPLSPSSPHMARCRARCRW